MGETPVPGQGPANGPAHGPADAAVEGGVDGRAEERARPTIAVQVGSPFARIMSVGAYRPSRVVTNAEICTYIDSSDEWIRERSGIEERRWAAQDETVVDMAAKAALIAIERAGLRPQQIDAVLVASITHPYQTPSAAAMLTDRIGATPAAAQDISAACAGFCYGVSMASDMVRAGSAGHVLVVGVEKLTDFVDVHDRSTAFIFGDGAGAVVIGPSTTPAIGPTVWGSDGSQWQAIANKHSWIDVRERGADWPWLAMAGQSVFRWAVWQMAPIAQKALDAAGVASGDLAAFIPHQANMRIVDAMAKQLGLPSHVPIARDLRTSGNTSAASIPLAMDRMLSEGEAPHGGLALLIGFGAGLVYAAQVVELP